MPTPVITVIIASTRPTRFADLVAPWLFERLAARDDLRVLPLDLREHSLPQFDDPRSPATAPRDYASDEIRAVGELLDAADGFLVLTNEYNHGYSGALKNVLDHFFVEYRRKPMAFAGYGSVGASRAIEQLRQVASELEVATTRHALHIPGAQAYAIHDEATRAETLAALQPRLDQVVTDLVWWANALAGARAQD